MKISEGFHAIPIATFKLFNKTMAYAPTMGAAGETKRYNKEDAVYDLRIKIIELLDEHEDLDEIYTPYTLIFDSDEVEYFLFKKIDDEYVYVGRPMGSETY